jgi:hypothetical protein
MVGDFLGKNFADPTIKNVYPTKTKYPSLAKKLYKGIPFSCLLPLL